MLRSRRQLVGLVTAGLTVAGLGLWSPAVEASGCVLRVTVLGGLVFNVPVGTPISSLVPPGLKVLGVTEVCPTTTTAPTSTTTTTTTTTTTSSSSSSSSTTTTSAPAPSGPSSKQHPSSAHGGKQSHHHGTTKHHHSGHSTHTSTSHSNSNSSKLRSSGGVPSSSNPTFSLALPGAAPLGVPNFFIDSFRIPPFLLPIYQAAGIEYDVPWQVLAAINEIESDYGRNLSVSSAGAVGWMQFLPSTWKSWGVDANGDGVADPYNPVDAIFTAARYLQAAGASKDLARAMFAYNHAGWYVQSVLLRAKLIGGMPNESGRRAVGVGAGPVPGRGEGHLRG